MGRSHPDNPNVSHSHGRSVDMALLATSRFQENGDPLCGSGNHYAWSMVGPELHRLSRSRVHCNKWRSPPLAWELGKFGPRFGLFCRYLQIHEDWAPTV